ncbi:hypothetical protein HK096_004726 [Nowakowskiella sp. JEL0078]|nr:hypothetical protein HK096_004726 [Nowakowskiella sp. JEL0078]
MTTFYKRNLPTTCIPFNSEDGKRLFKATLNSNSMDAFFSLSQQFLTQVKFKTRFSFIHFF